MDEYVLVAAHCFTTLAAQLLAGGLDDSTGVVDVSHRLGRRPGGCGGRVGGAYGSSGNVAGL
ncbi:hypothetical protein ACFWAZ_14930 [Streptomyces collinus]|uniref:hypothetical protein n=1 Tax=Streptomyces collinus TaxID=42684 RepID=UPI003652CB2F